MKGSSGNAAVPRKRKILRWIFWLLAIYGVIGFLILPPIVRVVAVKQISKQLDREVSIKKIKINPFALSTTIDGLLIKDRDGEPFISWDEVYVNFQLSSFFGKAWVFKEISTTKPFVRAQMNWDGTFNFSDLIAKFSNEDATNAPAKPKTPSKPLMVRVDKFSIIGATASLADFTVRTPFKRVVGPLDITLENFSTDPDNKNPYSFSGTTDAGERITWNGFFYLDPIRSGGELTLDNLELNKYAPLYQSLVQFEIRSGTVGVHASYQFEYSATNHSASVTNVDTTVRNFRLGAPGDANDLVEIPFSATIGASADLQTHQATVQSVITEGAKIFVRRAKNNSINLVELAKPADTNAPVPGGILFLLHSVTNAVALILNTTNDWAGTIENVSVTNCALHFEDLANSRPAKLDLTDISLSAKNISNLADTNATADFSLRWNTNGSIKMNATAALMPPTADLNLDLDQLDLGTLDPYLESKVNLFILGSKIGLHGHVHLRTPENELPTVTFHGDASLDGFRTADGVTGSDLLRWDSVHINGIHANLNPPVAIIKQIAISNAYARVVIETNHTINLLDVLKVADTNSAPTNRVPAVAKDSAVTNSLTPQISIGEIFITNTAVSFTDHSLKPNVNLTVEQVNGTIEGISSEQLQHADVNLNAKINGVGPATITGVINPFNQEMTNNIKVTVKDVDLTPTSPYAGKFAGYEIAEGKLNMDLTYKLVGKKLSSENVIVLDQFTFGDKVNSPDATHLPVRLAIAILKDREGKITLDVPVDGSLDDPKFRIGKVVTYAIVNILEKVATSPFSLLGAILGGGGEELGYQDFAPGSAELTMADKQKLDSMTKALYARPALKLEISGSVDPDGDREGLQRAALDEQIRTRIWQKLHKSEKATTTADQIVLTPEDREHWIKKLYSEAMGDGRITPELIAANTNLAGYATSILSSKTEIKKGAVLLIQPKSEPAKTTQPATGTTYQTKLIPPPDPTEAILLTLFPFQDGDLQTLAASRAQAVQTYLLQSGKVEASRLFLTAGNGAARSDGSRVYLQFR